MSGQSSAQRPPYQLDGVAPYASSRRAEKSRPSTACGYLCRYAAMAGCTTKGATGSGRSKIKAL